MGERNWSIGERKIHARLEPLLHQVETASSSQKGHNMVVNYEWVNKEYVRSS